MKNCILIVFCCASLMLVTPFTTVAQENTVSNNLPEQPDDVEGLVAQIRTVVDEILQKYGHIQSIKALCIITLNILELFGLIILCVFLIAISIPIIIINLIGDSLGLGDTFIWKLFTLYLLIFIMIVDNICYTLYPWNWFSLYKSKFTIIEIKDITHLAKDCLCLQE